MLQVENNTVDQNHEKTTQTSGTQRLTVLPSGSVQLYQPECVAPPLIYSAMCCKLLGLKLRLADGQAGLTWTSGWYRMTNSLCLSKLSMQFSTCETSMEKLTKNLTTCVIFT